MSIDPAPLTHPLLRCAAAVAAAVDEARGSDPTYLSIPEKRAALVELSRAGEQLQALVLRVMAVSDDVSSEDGARSVAAWLDHTLRTGYADPARALRLAHALDRRWHQLAGAFAAGHVNQAQAHVIAQALDDLPDRLGADLQHKAEAHLIEQAAHFGPRQLKILGERLLEVLAPDIAEEEERRRLAAQERAARRTTRLTMRSRGDGATDILARVPDHVAARLRTYLESFSAPRRHPDTAAQADDEVAQLPHTRRLGEAFCAMLERLPATVLPQHGGTATTVMVTLSLDQLLTGLGAADLATGERITAGEARRLACTANLVPVVLGTGSEVLDLGRTARLFSPAQRKALVLRDRECRTDGCTIPAAWCEAHHRRHPWSKNGRTDLADGLLLCSWHHHRAHDPAYDTSHLPNGDVRFTRRR